MGIFDFLKGKNHLEIKEEPDNYENSIIKQSKEGSTFEYEDNHEEIKEKSKIEIEEKALTKDFSMNIVSIEPISSLCAKLCEGYYEDCPSIGGLRTGEFGTNFTITRIVIEVFNHKDSNLDIRYKNFKIRDNQNYIYTPVELCTMWESATEHISTDYNIPSASRVLFDLFIAKTQDFISEILYDYNGNNIAIGVDNNEYSSNGENSQIVKMKEYYEEKIKELESRPSVDYSDLENLYIKLLDEYNELKQKYNNLLSNKDSKENNHLQEDVNSCNEQKYEEISCNEEEYEYRGDIHRKEDKFLLKYEIKEDDDYWRIFSLEEFDTVSFNREFNKTKSNHNWINVGDPLITIKIDNVIRGFSAPTIMKSPVSGIFEFNKNKMIEYGEEICRIRKYPEDQKKEIIERLEKESIREALLKKEYKKALERETLAELMEEGKIFNTYTQKDGNRATIPMDIASAVWNRDGGKCCICGSRENLEFDHIIPVSKGGATTYRNLQLLCQSCNNKKSDKI